MFLYTDKNFFSEININTIKEKKETSKKQLFYDIIMFPRREDIISDATVISGILEEKQRFEKNSPGVFVLDTFPYCYICSILFL